MSPDGIALFERIRYRRHDGSVFMYVFDLIELNGDDLRREPLEGRKARDCGAAEIQHTAENAPRWADVSKSIAPFAR